MEPALLPIRLQPGRATRSPRFARIGVACLREQTSGRSPLYRGTRGSGNARRQAILFEADEALETRPRALLPVGGAGVSLPKTQSAQRADYSCERRRTERPAECTPAPHLMGSRAWDTPVLTCAESSRNGIDSGWGETPFLSENKALRRLPLVPVTESTDFRKFEYGTELQRLNGA